MGLVLTQSACDLQPKIVSLPDSVGDFISARYPALLADPNVNPEIYNSAVSDYGVYASPDLYGTSENDDYVMYASVDDYIVPPQADESVVVADSDVDDDTTVDVPQVAVQDAQPTDYLLVPMYGGYGTVATVSEITVVRGDTLYALASKHNTTVEDLAKLNNLSSPYALVIGQKLQVAGEVQPEQADVLKIAKPVSGVRTATRVELSEISVGAGDTLYSLSRRYAVPVNDLAVMNNLKPPFVLSVGQKLRVPNLASAPVASVQAVDVKPVVKSGVVKESQVDSKNIASTKNSQKSAVQAKPVVAAKEQKQEPKPSVQVAKPVKKISSDPTKKLPKITARSSSRFSWPVRGKILSAYGAKSSGLFNDGINIGVARGTTVAAAENGVVAYAGNEVKGMGNLIILQHDGGWMTVYAHLDTMLVKRGTKVKVGQKIGTVGKTGKVDVPQLHFEIRKGTKAYNPTSYMKK